jgi:hypothetical protein
MTNHFNYTFINKLIFKVKTGRIRVSIPVPVTWPAVSLQILPMGPVQLGLFAYFDIYLVNDVSYLLSIDFSFLIFKITTAIQFNGTWLFLVRFFIACQQS